MSQSKKDRATDLRLRKHYGITLAEYNRILKWQKGCCAICKKPATTFKTRLAVDHCHLKGLLRGLLCWHCNRAIAVFRDQVDKLQSAVSYLSLPPITAVFGEPRFTAPGRVGSKKRAKLLKAMQLNSKQGANV